MTGDEPVTTAQHSTLGIAEEPIGKLHCLFHRRRPHHVSGQADKLPFKNAATLRHTFSTLDLPTTYLQIADGSPAIAQAFVLQKTTKLRRLEFIAHCVTKQGDWA